MSSADRLPLSVTADDSIGAASPSFHRHRIFPGESYDDNDCQQDADLRIPASREPARNPTNSPQFVPRTRYLEAEARRQHASPLSPPSPSIQYDLLITPEESESHVCDDLSLQHAHENPANDESLSSDDRLFSQEIDSSRTSSVSGYESVDNASISDIDEEEIASICQYMRARTHQWSSNHYYSHRRVMQDFYSSLFQDNVGTRVESDFMNKDEKDLIVQHNLPPPDGPHVDGEHATMSNGGLSSWTYAPAFKRVTLTVDTVDRDLYPRYVRETNTILDSLLQQRPGFAGKRSEEERLSRVEAFDAFCHSLC